MSKQRPATRVLAVLELLQAHGRLSGAELAARLDIDGRSLRRYIVALEEMGIPITSERGRYGGYGLVAGFKIPPLIFTDDEALALATGLLAARQLGLEDSAPAIESARAKLERVMPDGLKRRVRAVSDTVQIDMPRAAAAGSTAVLIALSSAAQQQQRVHLHYQTEQHKTTQRDFDAYGLAFQNGSWYTVGMCHLRRSLRAFRLDRIVTVRLLDTHFVRPAQFDVVAHLRAAVATLPRAHAIEVLLHCPPDPARAAVPDWLGVLEPAGEGVLLRGQADDLDWFARQLAQLPLDFTVRRPAALRKALQTHAALLLARATA